MRWPARLVVVLQLCVISCIALLMLAAGQWAWATAAFLWFNSHLALFSGLLILGGLYLFVVLRDVSECPLLDSREKVWWTARILMSGGFLGFVYAFKYGFRSRQLPKGDHAGEFPGHKPITGQPEEEAGQDQPTDADAVSDKPTPENGD